MKEGRLLFVGIYKHWLNLIAHFFSLFQKAIKKDNFFYVLIITCVFLANIQSVFGLKVLLNDDLFRYWFNILPHKFPSDLAQRDFITPWVNHWLGYLTFGYPYSARLFLLICFMVPLSILCYRFFYYYLKIPRSIAVAGAIIPNIMPGQITIPAYINGSYCLWGMFLFLISMMVTLRKSESNKRDFWVFLIGLMFFWAAANTLAEFIVFLYPAVCLFVVSMRDFNVRRKITLVFSFGLVVGLKACNAILHPFGNVNAVQSLSISEQYTRLISAFNTILLPTDKSLGLFPLIVVFVIIMVSISILFFDVFAFGADKKKRNEALRLVLTYFTHLVWFGAVFFPFILVTKNFESRYFYLASFPFIILIFLSLYLIIERYFKIRKLFTLIVGVSIIVSGVLKIEANAKYNDLQNSRMNTVLKMCERGKNVKDAQFVLFDVNNGLLKYARSTGYIKFVTKRDDCDALIGPEIKFYNPFVPVFPAHGWGNIMSGLDIDKPIFISRYNEKMKVIMSYDSMLVWDGVSKDSRWVVYEINQATGGKHVLVKGVGLNEYQKMLKKPIRNKIDLRNSAWGGVPSLNDEQKFK